MKQTIALLSLAMVGGLVYWLMKDPVKFDSSHHTKKKLVKMIDNIFIEHATAYCSKLHAVLELRRVEQYDFEAREKLMNK